MDKIQLLKEKFENRCGYCGEEIIHNTEIDFIDENNIDGEDIENMMPICVGCFICKESLSREEFREKLVLYSTKGERWINTNRTPIILDEENNLVFHFEKIKKDN